MDPTTGIASSPGAAPEQWPNGPSDAAEVTHLSPEDMPQVDHLVTEDDIPLDNMFSGQQQRLLVLPLREGWQRPGGGPFVAATNVGLFYAVAKPPLVPDMLLSLDVKPAQDLMAKKNRSYFVWVFGKCPDVVVEVVSNIEGGEDTTKLRDYARIGVPYYVIFDPEDWLHAGPLRAFALHAGVYQPTSPELFAGTGLGLALWQGVFEDVSTTWLRWCDDKGRILPTALEQVVDAAARAESERRRAENEQQRAENEQQRAENEQQRAENERRRAEGLAEQLRALGQLPAGE